ncbi:MAG: HD-GYP domain-containing protein [Actinobacteria bacterium]|nr:HD-GYP domain-containing protein [Actinomycetota bacterium]
MREGETGALLTALRRAATLHRLYGSHHPLTDISLTEAARAADVLAEGEPAQLTIIDGSLYVNRALLPMASLSHSGFLQTILDHGVTSVTLVPPVRVEDLAVLTATLAGDSPEPPTAGSVRLNEDNLAPAQRDEPRDERRMAYTATLDLLRAVSLAVVRREQVSLSEATAAVRTLMDLCLDDPAAALLLSTMKNHHEYTFFHSVNTCILTLMIGQAAGLDRDDQILLGMGALLHDIGKVGISPSVLQHPGRLTPEMWKEIKQHPQMGAEAVLLASEPGQEVVAVVALEHHARYDGSGYPNLLYFEEPPAHTGSPGAAAHPLHLFTRLTAVADGYDAVTSRRAYRRAATPPRALRVLLDGAGTMYDPDVVHAFIDVMGEFPPGSLLRLRGGETVLVSRPAGDPDRPVPALMMIDAAGRRLSQPEPLSFHPGEVAAYLTPERAGVTPALILEHAGPAGVD